MAPVDTGNWSSQIGHHTFAASSTTTTTTTIATETPTAIETPTVCPRDGAYWVQAAFLVLAVVFLVTLAAFAAMLKYFREKRVERWREGIEMGERVREREERGGEAEGAGEERGRERERRGRGSGRRGRRRGRGRRGAPIRC